MVYNTIEMLHGCNEEHLYEHATPLIKTNLRESVISTSQNVLCMWIYGKKILWWPRKRQAKLHSHITTQDLSDCNHIL